MPPGVSIERIQPSDAMYQHYLDGEFLTGDLPLKKWPDSLGVAVVCGMLKSEFVKAVSPHLVGVDSEMFGDDDSIDEDGAEVILEEAYDDSQVKPFIPQ